MLKQGDDIIGYYSGTLNETQRGYSATEKELYAVIWAIMKTKGYLQGREFGLVTDHKALAYYKTKPGFGNPRIRRWHEELDEYNFKVQYRPGEEMAAADALSRCLSPSTQPKEVLVGEVMMEVDKEEADVLRIHQMLNHRKSISQELARAGIDVTPTELRHILGKCRTCLERDNQPSHSSRCIETTEPGEMLGLDLMEYKNDYIVVVIDYFSRKTFTQRLGTKHAGKMVPFLNKVYHEFPFKKIISDRGREFERSTAYHTITDRRTIVKVQVG